MSLIFWWSWLLIEIFEVENLKRTAFDEGSVMNDWSNDSPTHKSIQDIFAINKDVYVANSGVALSPHFYIHSNWVASISQQILRHVFQWSTVLASAEYADEDWCKRFCDTLNRQGVITHLVAFLSLLLWSFEWSNILSFRSKRVLWRDPHKIRPLSTPIRRDC